MKEDEEATSGLLSPNKKLGSIFSDKRKIKIFLCVIGAIVVLAILVSVIVVVSQALSRSNLPPVVVEKKKNVIMIIVDGFGPGCATLSRVFTGKNNSYDEYLVGSVRTYSGTSFVTDSAAAATAYACGVKTYNEAIGVDLEGKARVSWFEAAKKGGWATGLVSTSRVTHATPGSFSAHVADRNSEELIALQQIEDFEPDVLFGGGENMFDKRKDKYPLLQKAQEKGYSVIKSKSEFNTLSHTPALGLFATSHMAYEIDRWRSPEQPSLSEMAKKALELLETSTSNSKGFVAMIESSRVDMAEHENDPSTLAHELRELDNAFQTIMEYVKAHNSDLEETTIVMTADHETGGLSLGKANYNSPHEYPVYAYYPQYLEPVKCSGEWIEAALQNISQIEALVSFCQNMTLSEQQIEEGKSAFLTGDSSYFIRTISQFVSDKALIGWTTWGHSGSDVNLYSYGPLSSLFSHNMNNIDIPLRLALTFGWTTVGSLLPSPPTLSTPPSATAYTVDPYHPSHQRHL